MSSHLLTPRERQIFELLIKNESTDKIALKLNISEKTVRNHISNVICKLGVNSRTQAILELLKFNILKLDK
jgi:LuxR family transcriptional regulator of spore coat protein